MFITLESGEPVIAKLLVAADGANSAIRKQFNMPITFKDYDHHAIVATVKTADEHNNTARQVFLPTGPLAFLPCQINIRTQLFGQQALSIATHF